MSLLRTTKHVHKCLLAADIEKSCLSDIWRRGNGKCADAARPVLFVGGEYRRFFFFFFLIGWTRLDPRPT